MIGSVQAHDLFDTAAIGQRLGIDDEGWLRELADAGPPPERLQLPVGDELTATLRRLGFADADVREVAQAAPGPERTPELWWVLERCAHRTIRTVGRWEDATGPWPVPSPELGAEGRCLWVYVYLAVLPHIRRWHQERGVPDDVSWATLADLGRHVARFRRRYGVSGLDSAGWLRLHFSGGIYALGRLQFNLFRIRTCGGGPRFWYQPDDARASEPGFRPGDPVLGMHIPESGPLDPDACDESVRRASSFFPRYFPEHRFGIITCTSWLLDEQLAHYLPAESNIVRFQNRFQRVQGAADGDHDIFWFVYHQPPEAIDTVKPRSTLERAIVTHVRSGKHWHVRTGWLQP